MSSETLDYIINLELGANCYSELRKLEISLFRILGYIRRLTGNENVENAIVAIQRLITIIRMAQIAIRSLQIASGPIGWLYAATTVIGLGFAVGESMAMAEVQGS